MGLPRGAMQLLLDECVRKRFSGSVATLGRQHVYFGFDQLQQLAARRELELSDVEVRPHREPRLARQGFISDDTFLKAIGFSEVTALDYSDYEQADCLVDLNREVPLEMHGRFDVIIDGGTLEHVFHLPQALKNLHLMLRPDGRIIHLSPASNFLDHGFYMFSPTLFWDYYSANGYAIETARVIRHTADHPRRPWEVSIYFPGALDAVGVGGLDEWVYSVFFVVTKTAGATCDRIPQQGHYQKTWNHPGKPQDVSLSRGDRFLERTRGMPVVEPMARMALRIYRSIRLMIEHRRFTRSRRGIGLEIVSKY